MKRASISEAKNGLSALLEEVRRGEAVLLTHRGNPVARIESYQATEPTAREAEAELVRRGVADPPRTPLDVERFLAKPVPRLADGISTRGQPQPNQPFLALGDARLDPDGEVEVSRTPPQRGGLVHAPLFLFQNRHRPHGVRVVQRRRPCFRVNIQRQRLVVTRFRLRQPSGLTVRVSEMPHRVRQP